MIENYATMRYAIRDKIFSTFSVWMMQANKYWWISNKFAKSHSYVVHEIYIDNTQSVIFDIEIKIIIDERNVIFVIEIQNHFAMSKYFHINEFEILHFIYRKLDIFQENDDKLIEKKTIYR
jgi:hypothetical protein